MIYINPAAARPNQPSPTPFPTTTIGGIFIAQKPTPSSKSIVSKSIGFDVQIKTTATIISYPSSPLSAFLCQSSEGMI
jgi:hypothetical protein